MDQPLSITSRQRLSCLLITTLTLLLSQITMTNSVSVELRQSLKTLKTDHNFNNGHRTIVNDYNKTKDIHTYKNFSESFDETSTNTVRALELTTITPSKSDFITDSNLFDGIKFLKFIYALKQVCWNKNDVVDCVKDKVIELMSNILYSSESYEDSNDLRINEIHNDVDSKIYRKESNITLLEERLMNHLRNYQVSVTLPELLDSVEVSARAGLSWLKPAGGGKSTFLTGFGLGFLAFALKKLLLPLFIGAQIVKSVLIAMFLPSILGGLGKLVGKGVSTFASASGSSGPSNNNVDDFEFKDNMGFENTDNTNAESKFSAAFTYPESFGNVAYQNALSGFPAGTLPATALYMPNAASGTSALNRFPQASSKVSYASLPTGAQHHYGSYYTRHQQPNKKQDYKVFHNIPSSSLLLTNYDPFYSPLLSRLDSVFKQLGYETENCRERLVCAMYNNPAKFAPYSNLVSAQLSRELNELRKPSTDNPEILRFFRYMKAAKDGQDGKDCIRIHPGCSPSNGQTSANPPMIKTYHDINKLVQARRLGKSVDMQEKKNPTQSPTGDTN